MPPPSGVDITTAEFLVGIGWGIKDASNIPQIEELAKTLGGTLACSRPIVDKGWPPNDRQVGSSGKTIKPKLYIALGISGAFQHVLGMKSSDLIIAVNEDSKAARARDRRPGRSSKCIQLPAWVSEVLPRPMERNQRMEKPKEGISQSEAYMG